MSEYIDQKYEIARKIFSTSIKNLIDITKDSYYDHSNLMSYFQYILQFRTLHVQAPRQLGKTTILKEVCSDGLKTLFIVYNSDNIRSLYKNPPKNVDIKTQRWISSEGFERDYVGKTMFYDRIIFDECYDTQLLERIITKMNMNMHPNYHMSVIALGTMS